MFLLKHTKEFLVPLTHKIQYENKFKEPTIIEDNKNQKYYFLTKCKRYFPVVSIVHKKTPGKIIWDNEFKLNHIYIFINITSKKIVNRNSFVNNVIFFVSWK